MMAFIALALFISYDGHFIATDEMFLFDATESLARRGNMQLNLTNDLIPMTTLHKDPMFVIAATPWFWLIERLPGVGMAQGMLLFNNLVTCITAGVLFSFARTLGYNIKIGLTLGLLFGLGSIAWPYSKTFFREPLTGFFLLLGAYALERWRQTFEADRTLWHWLALGILAVMAAQLTKEAALLALPALLILAVPRLNNPHALRARRRQMLWLTITTMLVIAALAGYAGYEIIHRLANAEFGWLGEAVGGYLISPGKSLFVYSPALLLGIIGIVALAKRRAWRYALAPAALLAAFVVGYAVLHKYNWFGGKGWGPRYMLPLTGFLLLPALPILEGIQTGRAPKWARYAALTLIVLSIGVQIAGAMIPVGSYFYWIENDTAWTVGVWDPAQTHLAINLKLLRFPNEWGMGWWRVLDRNLSIPALCGLLMLGIIATGRAIHQRALRPRRTLLTLAAIIMATGALFYFALTRYTAADRDYMAQDERLHAMLDYLDQVAAPEDVILLNNPQYRDFFYNFNKLERLHIVTMPYSPGAQPSPDQPPQVTSDNPDRLVRSWIPRIVNTLADTHDIVWLVVDSGPFVPWSVRPVEQWMARHYFPIDGNDAISAQVRVVRYSTADAPLPAAPPWPCHTSGATFGAMFKLIGYDSIRKGRTVNLSLMWQVEALPPLDYNIGLFLIGPDDLPVTERHSAPVGGFGHTSQWAPGRVLRDNHALLLPPDLPPGTYSLQMIFYDWQDGTRLDIIGPNGASLGDMLELDTIMVE